MTRPHLPPIELSESFAMAHAVHEFARALRRTFDRRARALGYTQSQWRVLWGIAKNPGTSQAALADNLELQPIALARILDRMEGAGLVERAPDPNDRRAVKLFLTDAAAPIINVLHGIAEEVLGLARRNISPEREAEITRDLKAMRAALEHTDKNAVEAG